MAVYLLLQGTYLVTMKDIYNLRSKILKEKERLLNKPLQANDEFDSFKEFEEQLVAYSKRTHTQFVKALSTTVQVGNRELAKFGKRGRPSKQFDEKHVYKKVHYRCKHGEKRSRKKIPDCERKRKLR